MKITNKEQDFAADNVSDNVSRNYRNLCGEGVFNSGRHLYRAIAFRPEKTLFSFNDSIPSGPTDEHGGIIVFPADMASKNQWLCSKLREIAQENGLGCWAVGNYFNGSYIQTFSEESISVAIFGIDFEALAKIAEASCQDLAQKSVLVKDNGSQRVILIEQ